MNATFSLCERRRRSSCLLIPVSPADGQDRHWQIDIYYALLNGLFHVLLRGHLRPDLLAPHGQPGLQFLRLFRHPGRQIRLLAQVLLQVVQLEPAVLEELHELPVARANGPNRRGPPQPRAAAFQVTREVDVDRLTLQFRGPIAEEWHQALTVEHLVLRRFSP